MTFLNLKRLALAAPLALTALAGCTRDGKFQPVDMWNGSRLKPYEQVNFFEDKSSSRVPPPGTVARSQARTDEPLYYGTQNGALVAYNPIVRSEGKTPKDRLAILQRGQERYNIYCQPCHGLAGYGDGMIVQRGLSAPPSYHETRLKTAPDGHIFDVITNGYGSMYSYAQRVPTRDRWAIVAYIRALQRSQDARPGDVPAGTDVSKTKVTPEIDQRMKYMGPSAGREYHGTGPGGRGNPVENKLNEEQGTNKTGEDTAH
jgi:mono/diheme cytochrome c family protein